MLLKQRKKEFEQIEMRFINVHKEMETKFKKEMINLEKKERASVKLLDGKGLIGLQVIIRNLSMNIHMVSKIGLKM